ncbi:helix-turn-helix transcriptional regulator [Mycetocola spongiae]|uniref:helix-turn-helix transcriptional regulator n=1 Tax=Mycetocola spongiae TaxID=2859226 RepID=UPI001CF2D5FA|nr:WYL domain-containing protein [Mycetocola spongiae]UCR89666.1 WYL domain-containing protein [Mycetocola spongiae]
MSEPSTPAIQGRDRLAFLLSLVPYLIEHEQVSVSDAAAHFGVSETLVRESVRLIAVSGVPGETSSYQHEDLFDIDWDLLEQRDQIVLTHLVVLDDSPRFSAREAAALIAGLQYLSALPGDGGDEVIDSLMAKLTAGSSGNPAQVAVSASPATAALEPVRRALSERRELEFDYLSSDGGRQHRTVDPLRVESLDQDWYLRGWCHLRQAVRTFRLDRMASVVVGEATARHAESDLSIPEAFFHPSETDLTVSVNIDHAALPMIAEFFTAESKIHDEGGRARVNLRLGHVHGFKRVIAGLSGLAEVTDPGSARREVAAWAREALARYGDTARPEDSR